MGKVIQKRKPGGALPAAAGGASAVWRPEPGAGSAVRALAAGRGATGAAACGAGLLQAFGSMLFAG
jgi:hypothetical protein